MLKAVRRWSSYTLITLFATAVVGCGGEGGSQVVVSGNVTADGEPVEMASLTFIPSGTEGRTVNAITGTDGSYTARLIPAEYKVAISKIEGEAAAPFDPDENPDEDPTMLQYEEGGAGVEGAAAGGELISPQFSDPKQTTLTLTVPEGGMEGAADFQVILK